MFRSPGSSRGPSFRRRTARGGLVWGLLLCVLLGVTAVIFLGGAYLAHPSPGVPLRATPTSRLVQATRQPQSAAATPVASSVPASPVAGETPTPDPALQAVNSITPVAMGSSRFAFVLLGYGGPNHDGPYLTDSIVVVVADPAAKTIAFLSVPRDSWVPLSFDGATDTYNKINTAYAFAKDPSLYPERLAKYQGDTGPGTFAADTISRVTGIPISYYAGLDFQGFRQMIDAVGGVDVTVPDSFSAMYPANDDSSVDASWMKVSFTAGPEHMNGERAIEFARARESIDNPNEGSDFARSRRQRLIMEAFKNRLLQPAGFIHLPQLLSIAATHVDTNYSLPNYSKLAPIILGWKDVKIYDAALSTANYLAEGTGPDGTYALVPANADRSWAPVRAFGRRLWNDPELGAQLSRTQVVVVNASGVAGLGARVSAQLAQLGYAVGPTTIAPTQANSQVLDESSGSAPRVIDQLLKDLNRPNLDVVTASPADSPEISLVLGADAADLLPTVASDPNAPTSILNPGSDAPTPTATVEVAPTQTPTPTPELVQAQPTATPVPASGATPITLPGHPNMVVVPRLVGLSEADAQRIINQSDLMTTYVNYQTADQVANKALFNSIPPGAVLSTSPPAGTLVSRGTRVALAVRKP